MAPRVDDIAEQRERAASAGFALLRPLFLVFAVVVLLFAGFEVVEQLWLKNTQASLLPLLHRVRAGIAGMIAAGLAGWIIAREGPALLAAGPLPGEAVGVGDPEQKRLHYARWFILLRWIAVVVATVAAIGAVELAELLPEDVGPALGAIIAWLTLLNLAYSIYLRHAGADTAFLAVQVYTDIVVLILLLHFSGGIENPLTPLLLLHVIIAGIVLGRAHAYRVAAVASILFGLLAWTECIRLLPHYTLRLYPHFHVNGIMMHAAHDPLYAGSRVALQAVVLLLVAYFTTTLVERIRQDERQLEAQADRALVQAQSLERALAEQREAHARAMRAERLAAVGELAGQVAHEVNNPIAIISAKARLMLRAGRVELAPDAAREVIKIAELSDRVARIAQGLLSYCRPAPGARTTLDPTLPARRALAYIEARAADAHVQVRDELPAQLPLVHANAAELEQVFLNLYLNALDAMPDGGELRISAGLSSDCAGGIAVHVNDTGCGIPPELRERVFEPFLTTKPGHGTGLGLSICQGLVRSHGGDIQVACDQSPGTRVTVSLPVLGAPAALVAQAQVHHA